MAVGVSAGAYSAVQEEASKSFSPIASATVGTSGNSGSRWSVVVASTRTRPDLNCGKVLTSVLNIRCACPATTASVAGASPL
ncbi:hypothetical protein D3C71_1631110 [compost metagenome]